MKKATKAKSVLPECLRILGLGFPPSSEFHDGVVSAFSALKEAGWHAPERCMPDDAIAECGKICETHYRNIGWHAPKDCKVVRQK